MSWAERWPLALSILALLIATTVCWLFARAAGYSAIELVTDRFKPEWLALMFGARFASYAGYTVAHGSTLSGKADIPMDTRMKLVAFGSSATSLGGGFALDRKALQRAGASAREATVRVIGLGALEWATLAPVAWIYALTLLDNPRVDDGVTTSWAVGVPLGVVLAGAAAWRLNPRALVRKGPVARGIARCLEALSLLRTSVLGGAGLLGMAMYWAAEIVSLWAALRAFGVHPGIAVTTLGYATGHVLTPRSAPLSGAGITELMLPLSLNWVGIPLAGAVPAVFAYRAGLLVLSIPPALLARADVQRLVRSAA